MAGSRAGQHSTAVVHGGAVLHRVACRSRFVEGAPYTRGTNPASAAARDAQGRLVHLDRVEHSTFWARASIEFLRHRCHTALGGHPTHQPRKQACRNKPAGQYT
ncbi:hypothetical protein ADK90_27995 [Streptomyces sp. XY413]|nr:hypothetical protein ADK96_18940 [Streptomyces sp. IGB124]KOV16368.1 hypothetical protein ADK90_27995 [Streptomyces sp. XY413]